MKWVTIFERANDVHKFKDVGIIPSIIKDKEPDFTVELWSYNELNIDNVKTIKIKGTWRKPFISLSIIFQILLNAKRIDVLNVYHLRYYSLIYSFIYKIRNRRGFVYLKSDMSRSEYLNSSVCSEEKNKLKSFFIYYVYKFLLINVDLVSVENVNLLHLFKRNSKFKNVILIRNGVRPSFTKSYLNDIKPNELNILTVGRIGTYQKNNELLIEALKGLKSANLSRDWLCLLAGPVEKEISGIAGKTMFLGNVSNSDDLKKIYEKSDVFILTSRFEGFPISLIEAGYTYCIPIVSHYCYLNDLINNGVNGFIFSSISELKEILQDILSMDNEEINRIKVNFNKTVKDKCDFDVEVSRLLEYIKRRCSV